ncbi:MAG: hypothetical protein LH473_10945 [Chitinophagales bacterium]|nr:hypothetical protein [Chitinophagales bacterium]
MDIINKKTDQISDVPKQSLLKLAEISILLDSYDSIFSDFDPNPYSERTLSDDFIIQSKKISRNKSGKRISLRLLLPADKRNEEKEKVIIKRLHSYFKSVHQEFTFEVGKINRRGIFLTVTGIILMMAASYISFINTQKFLIHFLLVLFEPAGWFLLWAGLDHLVYSSKETKKDLVFYSKMTKSEIKFTSY